MNDDDLKKRISQIAVPAASETAQERARHRALIAYRAGAPEGEKVRPSRWSLLVSAIVGLAVGTCALAIFWPSEVVSQRTRSDTAVLAQVEALFPGQLNAVIERDGGVQLALAAEPQTTSDQPLVVEFRRGNSTVRVLSYSGRRVCLDLGGREVCFEALLGERGKVIVAGEDFIWTAAEPVMADRWKITATALAQR